MVKLYGTPVTGTLAGFSPSSKYPSSHDPLYTSYDPYKKSSRPKVSSPSRTYEHLLGELHLDHALGSDIKDITYYGSRKILGAVANDTDVLILVDNVEDILSGLTARYPDLYEETASLSVRDPEAFTSTRLGSLNLMLTASKSRFEKTKRAQAIVESLGVKEKEGRVLLFNYVFNGPSKKFTDEDFTDVILKKKELKVFLVTSRYYATFGSSSVPF